MDEALTEMDKDNFRSFLHQLGRIISSDGRIEIIREASYSYSFKSEQVISVIKELPREIEKEQAIVIFFSRIQNVIYVCVL